MGLTLGGATEGLSRGSGSLPLLRRLGQMLDRPELCTTPPIKKQVSLPRTPSHHRGGGMRRLQVSALKGPPASALAPEEALWPVQRSPSSLPKDE